MRAALAVAAAVLAFAPGAAAADYRSVFDGLTSTIEANYYDPKFNGRDWPAITARYAARLEQVDGDEAFRALGQQMLDELGVSHLALHPPAAAPRRGMGLGARWTRIDGETVVLEIDPVSAARAAGLRPGDRILDPGAIYGPPEQPAQLAVERCDGARVELAVPREAAYWPPRQPTISWSRIARGDGRSVGYIRADRFEDDGAQLADAAMAALGDTDGLVIDLRGNSGGNASALRLLSYFADEGPAVVLPTRGFLAGLDGPLEPQDLAQAPRVHGAYTTEAVFQAVSDGGGVAVLMTEDLGEQRYRGPVVVLIGEDTGSAAEGFAWAARLMTEAVLVGRDSAGALLSSERFDLPDGWAVTVPVHGVMGPQGQDFGDRPVPPHVVTPLTREAVCSGADPDLERAVGVLQEKWAGPGA